MRDCDMFRGFEIGEGDELAAVPPHGMVKGRWVYGSYLCKKTADENEVHYIWGLDHGPEGKVIAPFTLGRCTGVFDSDDEIVYEGDIIKCEAEKSVMCVKWVDSGAYFKVEYLYKDGIWTGADTQPVPFRSFLQTGKRFNVIGSLVTPTKQVQVHFPDYKKESVPEQKQLPSAKHLEIERGRKILATLDTETQKQLRAFVKKTHITPAVTKNHVADKSTKATHPVVSATEAHHKTHIILAIECSTYMSEALPLIRYYLKNTIPLLMRKGDELSIISFSGEGECKSVVERFEISPSCDFSYLDANLDRFLRPVGRTAFFDPFDVVISLSTLTDDPISFFLITSGNDDCFGEDRILRISNNVGLCCDNATIFGYGTNCNRKLLVKMAHVMNASLTFGETFSSSIPKIEKFLSGGIVNRNIPAYKLETNSKLGEGAPGLVDMPVPSVKPPNPVPVPVKSVMKVQPSGYRIEIPLKDFISSCKLLMRKALGKKKNMVVFSARDSRFSMEWGNVGSILPATGVWPQFASIKGNNFRGITEVPPRKDPVVLEIKGDRLWVDGLSCDCSVSGSSQKLSPSKCL